MEFRVAQISSSIGRLSTRYAISGPTNILNEHNPPRHSYTHLHLRPHNAIPEPPPIAAQQSRASDRGSFSAQLQSTSNSQRQQTTPNAGNIWRTVLDSRPPITKCRDKLPSRNRPTRLGKCRITKLRLLTIKLLPRQLFPHSPRHHRLHPVFPERAIHLCAPNIARNPWPPARLPDSTHHRACCDRHLACLLATPCGPIRLAHRRRGRHLRGLGWRRNQPFMSALGLFQRGGLE